MEINPLHYLEEHYLQMLEELKLLYTWGQDHPEIHTLFMTIPTLDFFPTSSEEPPTEHWSERFHQLINELMTLKKQMPQLILFDMRKDVYSIGLDILFCSDLRVGELDSSLTFNHLYQQRRPTLSLLSHLHQDFSSLAVKAWLYKGSKIAAVEAFQHQLLSDLYPVSIREDFLLNYLKHLACASSEHTRKCKKIFLALEEVVSPTTKSPQYDSPSSYPRSLIIN